MPTATLTYDLDAENKDFRRAADSLQICIALWEIIHMKKSLQWELESRDAKTIEYDLLDRFFEKIHEVLEDNCVNIDNYIE
jgi:hypothetical protein